MKVIHINDTNYPKELKKNGIVATLGFFDGVHLGHRYLINQLIDIAQSAKLPSAVITFPIHPRKVLHADYQPELLTTLDEKIEQLATTGIDYCIIIPFSSALAQYSAQKFIQEIISNQLHVKKLLIGYDHKFGKDRTDGFEEYQEYAKPFDMEVIQADQFERENIHHSSTSIRKELQQGDVRKAAQLLSYNYQLGGEVIGGNQLGRDLGFPTANIHIHEKGKIIPQTGVYAVWVKIKDRKYKGMLYIGTRPTLLEKGELRVEVNIFGFEGNLYDQSIIVEFIDFIRGDMKFDNIDRLKKQLEIDKSSVLKVLQ